MILYAFTILVSAFLLFQVQPVIAKIILPWFGGSAAVWTVCMLFFQLVLLLGYMYAHAVIRYLKPRMQMVVHTVVLAASAVVLPVYPDVSWKPAGVEEPTMRILGLLAVTIGLLVIFLTMYTTVIERTKDIGVLKSLGANRGFIVRALITESATLCVLGIAAGVGLSYAARAAFLAGFPTLSILITPAWILRAAGIALAGAVIGASYPAWVASRKDPVEALSYD